MIKIAPKLFGCNALSPKAIATVFTFSNFKDYWTLVVADNSKELMSNSFPLSLRPQGHTLTICPHSLSYSVIHKIEADASYSVH
jgi:hypothetical protein